MKEKSMIGGMERRKKRWHLDRAKGHMCSTKYMSENAGEGCFTEVGGKGLSVLSTPQISCGMFRHGCGTIPSRVHSQLWVRTECC